MKYKIRIRTGETALNKGNESYFDGVAGDEADGFKVAYISLGSNVGDSVKNLENALSAIKRLPDTAVEKTSGIFITAPVGYTDQNDFYNAAVKIKTKFPPEALLGALLGIEAALGRVRTFKNAPRIIDLDLLIYGDKISNTDFLTLPHPRMFERPFITAVLKPILSEDSIYFNRLSPVNFKADGIVFTGKYPEW